VEIQRFFDASVRALVVGAAFVALGACKDKPRPAGSAPVASAAASATGATSAPSPVDAARRLALAPSPGTGPADLRITEIEKALEALPSKLDYWILLGRAWVRKARETADPGFYLNADACATVGLSLAPGNKMPLGLHALVLLNDHKFAEAKALAEKVVDSDPGDPFAYGLLSDSLLELGQFDPALKAAQKMADLKPNLASYTRASYIRWLQGDVEEAISISQKAIDAGDPHDPEPWAWAIVQSAMIFWHRGDYAGAAAGFELARKRVREYPPALVGLGRVALANGDARRAAELFGRAYDQSPLTETAWLLGDARAVAGDAEGATRAYALVERFGATSDPRTLSLYYATHKRKPAEALKLAEAEANVRGDLYTQDALAWALYANGRYADARAHADRALALGTKDARLLAHAGHVHLAAGDSAEGKRLLREALALNPQFDPTAVLEAQRALAL
jgi:tetratricopeptide (TPR) repeat protein